MPRLIFKCPYIRGGSERAVSHLGNYVRYMATREGAQRIAPAKAQLPATKKQREMVEQLIRDYPLSRGLFEYEDYTAAPTRGNASEFITRALEDNYDQIAKRENYVSYIASRPRAQRTGAHALFDSSDEPLSLSRIADEVAHHPGNVWLPIISLRREDAARLGYDNAENWRPLLSGCAAELAEAMKIPREQFRWYAAFHNESHHPHIHMICYSADGKSGFLTKDGIARIKSGLAKRIFRQELHELYERQTRQRDELVREAGEVIHQMRTGVLENPRIEQLMAELAGRLKHTTGKKQYGFLKAPLKALVDEIVDELAKDSRVSRAYALWYELREDVLRTYREDLPERLRLSEQKEFKRIKNLVIGEALLLEEVSAAFSPGDEAEAPSGELTEPEVPLSDEDDQPESTPASTMEWSDQYRLARQLLFGNGDQPQDFARAFALFTEEAGRGNALAMHDLGRMYADGLGCDADQEQAQVWYEKALSAFLAVESERPNRYVEYRIGKLYAAGLGAEQDYTEAAKWLGKSASQNYPYTQYSLAGLYRRGQGVKQSNETAHLLYTKAAAKGFPYAAYELGRMYRDGVGCYADKEASDTCFAKAFRGFLELEKKSRDDKLQYRIGAMLLRGTGTKQNVAEAREWFEKSARLGNTQAQYQLAKLILADPDSNARQIAEAVDWMTKAAEAGQDSAQYALGKLYRDGTGVEKDPAEAALWFEKAARQGSDFAAYALGKLLLDGGDGLEKDAPAALDWLKRSAEAGNQYAQYKLGKLLLQGEDVPKDIPDALRFLTAAAEQGNQYAQYTLGKLYLLGKEAPRDWDTAIRWLSLSAAQGNGYAQFFLDHKEQFRGPSPFACATRLLHHMSRIFEERTPRAHSRTISFTDKKLRQRIREKKMAMGHKADDHEESGMQMG